MTITPTTGLVGDTVTVSGTGFGAAKSITTTYNDEVVSIISADASGSFSGIFSVPEAPAGSYHVVASDGILNDSTDFVAVASATISPTSGDIGEEVTVSGSGFAASSGVIITFDTTSVSTATTDGKGSFSVAITIPLSAGGAHTISATDGEMTKQFIFDVEQQAPPTPQLLLPLGEDKSEQPTQFDWADVADPSLPLTYTLQIARDEDFTDMVLEKAGLAESEYIITEEERLELTKKESPYYWRVKAIDGASNESGWTGAGSFYVGGFAWPAMPAWVRYLLLGFGILVIVVVGFWLGMKRSYSSF